jgi:hypothetical protein
MSIDLPLARRLVAWGLGFAFLTPFLLCFCPEPPAKPLELSAITGRVTYAGHPVNNMYVCLDSDGVHSAIGQVEDDGSFRLVNFQYDAFGAFPGRYRAHLGGYAHATVLPGKYRDARTSGLELDVAADWNYVKIELH